MESASRQTSSGDQSIPSATIIWSLFNKPTDLNNSHRGGWQLDQLSTVVNFVNLFTLCIFLRLVFLKFYFLSRFLLALSSTRSNSVPVASGELE